MHRRAKRITRRQFLAGAALAAVGGYLLFGGEGEETLDAARSDPALRQAYLERVTKDLPRRKYFGQVLYDPTGSHHRAFLQQASMAACGKPASEEGVLARVEKHK